MTLFRKDLLPGVRAALEAEYGSLENALLHFERRFGIYATRVMTEKNPNYLDPIVIKPVNEYGGVTLWDKPEKGPWSVTNPRPGSMTALLIKHGLIDPYAPTPKIAKVPQGKGAAG